MFWYFCIKLKTKQNSNSLKCQNLGPLGIYIKTTTNKSRSVELNSNHINMCES